MTGLADPLPFDIAPREVQALLKASEDFLLLDCRERDEHALARIAGATLMPMSELGARVAELLPHRQRRIVVHCHHGGRSSQVVEWLRQQSFTRAQNLSGGIDEWSLQVDPTVPRY